MLARRGLSTPPTMLQNRLSSPTLSFPGRGSDRSTGTDGSPGSIPVQGRLTAAVLWRTSQYDYTSTEAHSLPSHRPRFRVHSVSGSVNRACISGVDPDRLPSPGTAALATS